MGAGASRPRPRPCVLWSFSYSLPGLWDKKSGFGLGQRAQPPVPPWATHDRVRSVPAGPPAGIRGLARPGGGRPNCSRSGRRGWAGAPGDRAVPQVFRHIGHPARLESTLPPIVGTTRGGAANRKPSVRRCTQKKCVYSTHTLARGVRGGRSVAARAGPCVLWSLSHSLPGLSDKKSGLGGGRREHPKAAAVCHPCDRRLLPGEPQATVGRQSVSAEKGPPRLAQVARPYRHPRDPRHGPLGPSPRTFQRPAKLAQKGLWGTK